MTESNGRGPYEATTDVHSNYAAPDELEEGELEDGEDGDVEAAPREKLPEHNGSVLEKVPTGVYRQPYPLLWLTGITGRVISTT